jgi:DNA-binding CsgD family transcriptional regulator
MQDRAAPDPGGKASHGRIGSGFSAMRQPEAARRATAVTSSPRLAGPAWDAAMREDIDPVQWAGQQAVVALPVHMDASNAGQILEELLSGHQRWREVDDLLRRRPDLGTLAGEAKALRAQVARERGSSVPGASALTAAELRLLPLLSTHLSFPEIAGELFLSRHTIKSQANSIYRKLGVSSRSQAVSRSLELGLLAG